MSLFARSCVFLIGVACHLVQPSLADNRRAQTWNFTVLCRAEPVEAYWRSCAALVQGCDSVFAQMVYNCLRLKCVSHSTCQPSVGNVTWNICHAAETAPAVISTHQSTALFKESTSQNQLIILSHLVKDHLFFCLPSATNNLYISLSALPASQ